MVTGCTRSVVMSIQFYNLVSMQFIRTKITWPKHDIMLREVLPELFTTCTAFTMYCLLRQCDVITL